MADTSLQLDEDLEAVERRIDVRIVLSLPGRFTLASRRDMGGRRKVFPCRVVNMSCHNIAIATPVACEMGERVIAHIEYFGRFEGPIIHQLDGGFLMEIIAPKRERYALATKIEWYEKRKNHDAEENRQHVRIVPKNPHSTLVLADGTTIECLVKDVSASGIAVSADIIPEIGTPLAVGKVVGRVARRFNDGFAVQFSQLQELGTLEARIAPLR